MIHLIEKNHDVFVLSMNKPHQSVVNNGVLPLVDKTFYLEDFMQHSDRFFQKYFVKVAQKLFFNNRSQKDYYTDFGSGIFALRRIAHKIKEKKINIIHGAFGSEEATAAMTLSDMTGIHFSFETHAKDLFVHFRHSGEKIQKADKIFTISDYNRQYLVNNLKCPSAKIILKRVPFNKSYCDIIPDKPKKDNLVLSVCRLDPIKGLDCAIEAFKTVSQKYTSLNYLIIGDGPLKHQLVGKVKELSLDHKVTFLGDVTNEVALDYVAQSTLVLLPSVVAPNGDRDGIPTSLIESMYLKTPVISSRVSGIPELIEDGVNGFLTEPGNVNQLTEKMSELLSDKMLRVKMGEQARETIEKEFNVEKSTNLLINAWQEML